MYLCMLESRESHEVLEGPDGRALMTRAWQGRSRRALQDPGVQAL